MQISDAEFDDSLDWVAESTTEVVNKQEATEYFTTVFVVTNNEIAIHVLVAEGNNFGSDIYKMLYNFGKRIAADGIKPGAVFVAFEGMASEEQENIFILGYTWDGRANAAELVLVRQNNSIIRVISTNVNHYSNGIALDWTRNAAFEVMRGIKGD